MLIEFSILSAVYNAALTLCTKATCMYTVGATFNQ